VCHAGGEVKPNKLLAFYQTLLSKLCGMLTD
jgi:hypothetical protein